MTEKAKKIGFCRGCGNFVTDVVVESEDDGHWHQETDSYMDQDGDECPMPVQCGPVVLMPDSHLAPLRAEIQRLEEENTILMNGRERFRIVAGDFQKYLSENNLAASGDFMPRMVLNDAIQLRAERDTLKAGLAAKIDEVAKGLVKTHGRMTHDGNWFIIDPGHYDERGTILLVADTLRKLSGIEGES